MAIKQPFQILDEATKIPKEIKERWMMISPTFIRTVRAIQVTIADREWRKRNWGKNKDHANDD